jgi:hypothetical protein
MRVDVFWKAESVVRPASDREAGAVAGGDVARRKNTSALIFLYKYIDAKAFRFYNYLWV